MAVNLKKDSEDSLMAELNVTPLVDVMLVLLVIFSRTLFNFDKRAFETLELTLLLYDISI